MAFWNRDELPPELKDLKPEEISAKLKKADEIRVAAEKTLADAKEMETRLGNQTTELDTMRARMTELEANQRPPEPPAAPEDPPSPWLDPEKFVDQRVQGLAGVALQSGMMTAKMYFRQNLSERDLRIFKKYESEVDAGINTMPVAQRVMPQSYLNMFLYVKGSHEMDIRKAEADKTDFFSEAPSRGQSDPTPPADQLSDEEAEICRKFHYDPVKYLANKKSATLSQSSKGSYARYAVPTTTNRS